MDIGTLVHDGDGRAGMVVAVEGPSVVVQYPSGAFAVWHHTKVAEIACDDD